MNVSEQRADHQDWTVLLQAKQVRLGSGLLVLVSELVLFQFDTSLQLKDLRPGVQGWSTLQYFQLSMKKPTMENVTILTHFYFKMSTKHFLHHGNKERLFSSAAGGGGGSGSSLTAALVAGLPFAHAARGAFTAA